jgi:hypothetical protein
MVSVVDYRDEQYLSKLRGLGMSPEDEWKLYALRQHIFKISQLQLKYPLHPLSSPLSAFLVPFETSVIVDMLTFSARAKKEDKPSNIIHGNSIDLNTLDIKPTNIFFYPRGEDIERRE